jgi:S-adenosylmethionine hydrolase
VSIGTETASASAIWRAMVKASILEAKLVERRVVTAAAFKPKAPAAVFKDDGVYGTVTRLEPPFDNLETNIVLSDLRATGIMPASRFEMRCVGKTFTILLGEHWTDVPSGEWVAYASLEGDLIIARNGASAGEMSGCKAGDTIFLSRGSRGWQ